MASSAYTSSVSSYQKVIVQLLVALMPLALLAGGARAQQEPISEYAVKAALLVKLPRFVYLPRLEGGTRISLCVLGRNPFGGALTRLAQTPMDGRSVQVSQADDASQVLDCDFVFVARSEADHLRSTLRQLGRAQVVTVSDIDGFARAGGMVELACALEGDSAGAIVQLCEAHELELESVNRSLLRVLSELAVERPAGH